MANDRIFAIGMATFLLAHPLASQTDIRQIEIDDPVSLSMQTYELDNGLTVILSPDHSAPVVAVNLWYHVGSANEDPGRTGFAHLFEHMMFQGSANVDGDGHFGYVERAGGTLNGSTSSDRTNYYEVVPANFLEQVLWLESDRMAALLPAMTQAKLDNQRAVVQNERRQRIDNQPYGLAGSTISEAIYPVGHPYRHTVIGSMEDLNAASMEDVMGFFRRYYAPNNASLVIVGDFDPETTRQWVEYYFGDIASGPPIERPSPPAITISGETRLVLEDRVQLPRLYINWMSPIAFAEGDASMDYIASILGGGESSRLHRRLVFEDQLAQFVFAGQSSRPHAGEFEIVVQARPGVDLEDLLTIIDEEIAEFKRDGPTEREIQRTLNNIESSMIQRVQTSLGRADMLNQYQIMRGDPAYLEDDIERYREVDREAIMSALNRYVGPDRVILSVVPEGQTQLQAFADTEVVR